MDTTTSTLDALRSAMRPFRKFTFKIEGEDFIFHARKPSAAESTEISKAFNKTYQEVRDSLENEDEAELSLFKRSLQKNKADVLIKYIISAEKQDLDSEAVRMADGKPLESKEGKKQLELVIKEREEELATLEHDELVTISLDHRAHIKAYIDAIENLRRMSVVYSLYDEHKERLFHSVEDSMTVTEDFISEISTEIDKLLSKDVKASEAPLKQAD